MNESSGGSGLAIASMVLGIVALLTVCCVGIVPFLPALLGVIGVSLAGVSLSGGKPGKGMAIAGLVCSIIALIPAVFVIVAGTSSMSLLRL